MSLPDPRRFPDRPNASPQATRLYALAAESLGATTGGDAHRADEAIEREIASMLRGEGTALAALLDGAPSVAAYRHLWRTLARLASGHATDAGIGITLFAIPVCVVAGSSGEPEARATLSGVLRNVETLVAMLQSHGALGGNRSFGLANVLTDAQAIDVARLPQLLAAGALRARESSAPLALAPAPIEVRFGEAVHLRFLVGSAVGPAHVDVLRESSVGAWGMPLAQALIAQLAAPGVSLVALPRAPMALPVAVALGRAAQREVSAQLFASNAIRTLRATIGEPTAVLSAHVAPDAPGGGELRLSLSSPFSPRDASGFRCPLYPSDRVADVQAMLLGLLRDCRVSDIRVVSGVHPDREPLTGGPLLFKPDTIPARAQVTVH